VHKRGSLELYFGPIGKRAGIGNMQSGKQGWMVAFLVEIEAKRHGPVAAILLPGLFFEPEGGAGGR
jgi:hypothetical protein